MNSTIVLVIARGLVVSFDSLERKSIALDGYVQGPAIDVEGERFSFDHHEKCVRLVTRATCQQVMDALLLGLNPRGFTVHINDVDGDTALSVWLLRNPNRVTEARVRALVESVGAMDAHGPAYPVLDPTLCRQFFDHAMAPEGTARRNKTYGTCDLADLLETCVRNIGALVDEKLEMPAAETKPRSFKITHEGNGGWVMVTSNDFIFDLLYAKGYTKAIAYQVMPDGSYAYTVAKKSELVGSFPVGPTSKEGSILHALNKTEPGWGGGSTIGGAPRNKDGSRSRLTPDQVFNLVQGIIAS